MVLTMLDGEDTQTLLDGKKFNFMHSQAVVTKNFLIFPSSQALALAPPDETFTT